MPLKRDKQENAPRASEEEYRLMVENANEAIAILQAGILKFFNPQMIEITGYTKEELASKHFVELIQPEDQDLAVERPLSGDKIRMVDKAGNIKYVETKTVSISWDDKPATLYFISESRSVGRVHRA